MLSFFSSNLFVKGLSYPSDIDLIFDALDSNRDGLVSINEFCLFIEGVQQTLD